jgi:HEAT repeat protein
MQNPGQTTPPARRPPTPQPAPPPEFQTNKIDALQQADLVKLLGDSSSSTFEKAKACQRLGNIGNKEAVPALAALLTDPQLSHYARYGLEPTPDPAVDDALREALPKVKGKLLIGVLNSIGQRRKDTKAAAAISKLLYDSDVEVAQAAAASLGAVSGPDAAKALQDALTKTKDPVRTAAAGACLVCAEGLLASGERDQALALYNTLTATNMPKPVRLAAMHGIIAAETSLRRPR